MNQNKQQQLLCKYLFNRYIKIMNQSNEAESDALAEANFLFQQLIASVLMELDEDSVRILNNDFCSSKNTSWWYQYYSRSTYYRLREKSIHRFLRCLHSKKMLK